MREFWTLPLKELTPDEWEAICDGCAKCCYIFDTASKTQTADPCRLLDQSAKNCTNYRKRFNALTLDDGYRCHKVTLSYIETGQLPETCAYVRRHRGEALEQWQIDRAKDNYGNRR
jgi:hypothetical protein